MFNGIPASGGYAIGELFVKAQEEIHFCEDLIQDPGVEKGKLSAAIDLSKQQLQKIKEKTVLSIGQKEAEIFEAHLMLLEDSELNGAILAEIEENHCSAVTAVKKATGSFIAIFEAMEDEYLRERASDLKDVTGRLLANLTGRCTETAVMNENTILVACDLTPSDTAQLDRSKVIGFLTDAGGRTSHSAIMARTLEIPAVVGMGNITSCVKTGDRVIVDGFAGTVILHPSEDQVRMYEGKIREYQKEREELKTLVSTETVTKTGKRIYIAGNIGKPENIHQVLENGGDGVGLFRTEFLFMDRDSIPDEEEQYESFKYVLEKADGRNVVIRTLDIGGDKSLPYLNFQKEMNPFLGFRAIRICLNRKDLFKTQLRALLRASVHGRLSIMFPMISGLEEFLDARKTAEECMAELDLQGISYSKDIEWGIMIEIPSAAVCAEELAQHADFFSIGTNDLIQYTLAVDRMNEQVSYLYNPMHPAVLKLIKMTIDGAHKHGKWVGMCGEMAGDERAIPTLVEYGLDEFSMSAPSILPAKKLIRNMI